MLEYIKVLTKRVTMETNSLCEIIEYFKFYRNINIISNTGSFTYYEINFLSFYTFIPQLKSQTARFLSCITIRVKLGEIYIKNDRILIILDSPVII